ncbi:MAG: Holliday junction branch migration protein RuvA [Armatimonadota bacterium]
MIARLQGVVADVEAGRLVVDVQGVGYEVWVPESVLAENGTPGLPVDLCIRMLVREDDMSLYGFSSKPQRHLFDLLRGVQGCGAKTSLALIGTLGEGAVRDAILGRDTRMLTKAPGVGPKLAEKMVATLRDRVAEVSVVGRPLPIASKALASSGPVEDELLEACVALGYPRVRVEPFLDEARREGVDLPTQIRIVLKRLAR